jgi:DNA-binding Lrp family transcriptional regulator
MDSPGHKPKLRPLDRRLLNDFQHGLPLTATPFADIAEALGVTEQAVLDSLSRLQAQGAVSRIGPVFWPHSIGASTLAAMAVPPERLCEVAEQVSAHPQVNHNYEREHRFNLWFVATACDQHALDAVLGDIEQETGVPVMVLPMLEDYHIDLGFDIQWT